MDLDVYHVVRHGQERTVPLADDEWAQLSRRRGRFNNSLQPESLARIGRVLEVARSLDRPVKTSELIAMADVDKDQKGALGALRMLALQGVVHPRAGPRRQLLWCPGEALDGRSPRGAWRTQYLHLRELLRANRKRWHATDWLVIQASFDPDLDVGRSRSLGGVPRLYDGLPVNVFRDDGKNARKYVLGALKALYWLECVAWRHYTRQAVEWRWVAPVSSVVRVPVRQERPIKHDPYLVDIPPPSRHERVCSRADDLAIAFEEKRQRWIKENHPDKAANYAAKQNQRQRDREAKRKADLREAKKWLEDSTPERGSEWPTETDT
jgi:hypothetical protein